MEEGVWKYLHKLMNRNNKHNTLLLFYFSGMCQLSSFVNPYGGTLMFFSLPVSITIKNGAEFRGDRGLRRSLNASFPVGPHHTACKQHPFGFLAIRKQPCYGETPPMTQKALGKFSPAALFKFHVPAFTHSS